MVQYGIGHLLEYKTPVSGSLPPNVFRQMQAKQDLQAWALCHNMTFMQFDIEGLLERADQDHFWKWFDKFWSTGHTFKIISGQGIEIK